MQMHKRFYMRNSVNMMSYHAKERGGLYEKNDYTNQFESIASL